MSQLLEDAKKPKARVEGPGLKGLGFQGLGFQGLGIRF